MAVVRAPINGVTLRWARVAVKLSDAELGSAANLSAERIANFEAGIELPTYTQMRKLAKKLDRTAAFFFADPPAQVDVPATVDFRGREAQTPAVLAREMKRAEMHRRTVLDLDGPRPIAQLREVSRRSLVESAHAIRLALGIGDGQVPPTPAGPATFAYWRSVLEEHGFLVFQTTGIDLNIFRGLSVHHDTLPVILINGADSAGGKVFTLFHELAHIANRTSGLCVLNEQVSDEALCNAFSAEFLMPAISVMALQSEANVQDEVAKVAGHFRVSKLAAAVRLRGLNRIGDAELAEVREQSDTEWQKNRDRLKATPGAPPHWTLRYRDLGPGYLGTVFRALETDRVSILDATYLLNAKVPAVEQMLDEYYRAGRAS